MLFARRRKRKRKFCSPLHSKKTCYEILFYAPLLLLHISSSVAFRLIYPFSFFLSFFLFSFFLSFFLSVCLSFLLSFFFLSFFLSFFLPQMLLHLARESIYLSLFALLAYLLFLLACFALPDFFAASFDRTYMRTNTK